MATLKFECNNHNLIKTLTFRGQIYTELWEEEGTYCKKSLESQMINADNISDDEWDEISNILEDLNEAITESDFCNIIIRLNQLE